MAALGIAVLAALPDGPAGAAEYPSRPLRLIVGSSAGGGGDIVARTVIQRLTETMGQPVIIDNRGGAGGAIACELVAKAAPDGHTLLIASVGMLTINPGLYPKLAYAPLRDFAPVTLMVETPYVLIVHPALGVKTVPELVAAARGRPGQLNYASGGAGTGNHFSGELFKLSAGIDLVHVAFKGTGPAVASVVGGQTQIMFSNLLAALPQAKAGRLRALAVTSAARVGSAPELPTIAESGYAGFETTTWHALLLPARTPASTVTRLHGEMTRILQQPEMVQRLTSQGSTIVASTPQQLTERIRSETAKWTKVIREAGIKAE